MTSFYRGWVPRLSFHNFRGDFFGGLTAAIVALPLALAFGVASGAGPSAGLYGAIAIGFLAALFGGTPSQVSGPTGPMTVLMASVFTTLIARNPDSGLALAFTVVVLGGLLQMAMGALRLGKYITLIPYTVISGFMSGVGVIIILLQIGPLLGHGSAGGVVNALQQIPTWITTLNPAAAILGGLTLAIVFVVPPRLNRILPAPLIALVVGTLISVAAFPDSALPRIGEIPPGLPHLHWPQFTWVNLKDMLTYSIMLAVLGALDSLLTSLVADNLTHTQHDSDRELIGQGLGNCVSGLLGGLPGAGATMRTVINVQAGGRTSLSGIIHALVLAAIVFKAGSLTAPIPHAVLAGILIKVGVDIIDWSFLRRAHRLSLKATGLMYLVLLLTVFVDLITAVVVGVFIANLLTIKNITDLQIQDMQLATQPTEADWLSPVERSRLHAVQGRVLLFRLSGPMSFGAAKGIARRMGIVEDYEILILDFTSVPRLGITALLAIETMIKDAWSKDRQVFVVGAHGQVEKRLHSLELMQRMPESHQVSDRLTALERSLQILTPLVTEEDFRARLAQMPLSCPLPGRRRRSPVLGKKR
jgi:SulP family sulfate permease